MNDELIQDLKQFIAATVNQSTSDIRTDLSEIRSDVSGVRTDISKLQEQVGILESKVDEIAESIADALDTSNQDIQQQIVAHDARIKRLELKES